MTYKDLKDIIDQMTPVQLNREALIIDQEECLQDRIPFTIRFLCRSGSEEANKLLPEGIKINRDQLINKLKYKSQFLSLDNVIDTVQEMTDDPDQYYLLF